MSMKPQLVIGNVGVTGAVDVSGSTISLSNASATFTAMADAVRLEDGTTSSVLFACGSSSGAGDNSILAALTGKIRVLAIGVSAAAAVNATLKSDTGGGATMIWPTIYLGVGGSKEIVFPTTGICETAAAKALNLYLSAALAVQWAVVYCEV